MRTLVAKLSLTALVVALGSVLVIACGGNDKPPLTPDSTELPSTDVDAAAPEAPSEAPSETPPQK